MFCLHPVRIRNPRYKPNSKNGGFPDIPSDPRLAYLNVPCGKCIGCKKRKANDWRFRLWKEWQSHDPRRCHFVTFTFDDEHLESLRSELSEYKNSDNDVCRLAVRRFLERYRKYYGKSLRHWFITELGEETGRIHLHGVLMNFKTGSYFRDKFFVDIPRLRDIWSYGHIWVGWMNHKTINYITKYLTKFDSTDFKPLMLCSPGIGRSYITSRTVRMHVDYDDGQGMFFVTTSNGFKVALPRYYRKFIWDEDFLQSRYLRLLDDPPPLIFKGEVFEDKSVYDRVVSSYTSVIDSLFGYEEKNFYLPVDSILFNSYGDF